MLITAACRSDSTPSACAAATSGNRGPTGSPVNVRRTPSSSAAFTRAVASPREIRSNSDKNTAAVRQPWVNGTDRATN